MHSLNFCDTSPGSAYLAKSTNANTTTNPLYGLYFILSHPIHSFILNQIHSFHPSIPFFIPSNFPTQISINQKMPKTRFILFILPLLIASIGEAAPRGKANSAPITAENTGGYNGIQEKESVRDVNGAEGTEYVTEADQEVDQEEIPEDRAQEQMNEIKSSHKRDGKMVGEEEEEDYGHIHPRPHEAVDGKMPGIQHYKPLEETGYFRGDELPENAGHEEGREEDQLNQKEEDEKDQQKEEEEKGDEEDKEPKIGQNAHPKNPLGEENEGEDEANKQSGGTQADQPNLDVNGGEETKMNGGKGEKEGEKEEDEEEEKFLHIYPFLKSATPDSVTAFRALLRDQHLTKSEVEEKRKEWANDQPEEVKKGFFDWKQRLEAKRQKKMESIEKKLESKVKDGKNKLDDKTQQLYLEIKAVIVDQKISRHEECKQIRSLINAEDEELREYFLEQVKLRLIKFCLDEEEQQIVEDSMPPGHGPEEGKQKKDDGLPTSDGSDDLEQNHPPPAQLQQQKQQQTMINEGNGSEFAQKQQPETIIGEEQFDSSNPLFGNDEMNGKSPSKMGMEHGKVGEKEGMEGKAEIRETEESEENFDNGDAGKLDDRFDDKFQPKGKANFEDTEKMDGKFEDKFPKKEEAKGKTNEDQEKDTDLE